MIAAALVAYAALALLTLAVMLALIHGSGPRED
jgi:hypothetical protein